MKLKIVFLATLAIFFIATEILLLKRYREAVQAQQTERDQLLEFQTEYNKLVFEGSLRGMGLPEFDEIAAYFESNSQTRSEYLLVFYFTAYDCGTCLSQEIQTLNTLHQKVDLNRYKIIGIVEKQRDTSTDDIKQGLNIRIPVFSSDSLKTKLNRSGITRTPLLCFGSANSGKIFHAFFPTPEHKSKTDFLKTVKAFTNLNLQTDLGLRREP